VEASTLWSTATTAASNGSVNAQHDAMAPLSGLAQMVLMQIGEVAFGGVGSGLYGMLVFVVVAVFVSGLMVGRTPEYLGKKVEAFEMKMAALVVLVPSALILGGAAATLLHPDAGKWISAPGPHGFSQVLYAWTSAAANNGSAFNGLSADVPFLDWGLGLAMLAGRFAPIAAVLAMAGSLAAKKRTPPGPGTLPTHSPFFAGLLVAVVLLVGALTFLPALAVGPLAEHLGRARNVEGPAMVAPAMARQGPRGERIGNSFDERNAVLPWPLPPSRGLLHYEHALTPIGKVIP